MFGEMEERWGSSAGWGWQVEKQGGALGEGPAPAPGGRVRVEVEGVVLLWSCEAEEGRGAAV